MRHSSFCRARFLAVHLAGVDVSLLPRALCKRGRGPSCSYGGPHFTPQLRPQLWSPKVVQKAVDTIRVPIVGTRFLSTAFWIIFGTHKWAPQNQPNWGTRCWQLCFGIFCCYYARRPMTGTLCCRTCLGTAGAAALESIASDRARNYNDHTTIEKKALRCDCGSRFCAAMLAATNVHATVTSNTWTLLSSKAAATWQQKTVPRS